MHELTAEASSFLKTNKDKKIVFTNGCFDILHSGHISYLKEAQSQGDLLFVGLNSDQSVKRLKGDKRPINDEKERKYILESLACVDFVEIFEEDTPLNLIKEVKPDMLVKGGDWAPDQIVGSDFVVKNGGLVKSLSFKDGFSTTSVIDKILKIHQ